MSEIIIDNLNIFPLPQRESLVGFGNCEVNHSFRISGLALHIEKNGKLKIVWPAKRVGQGFVFFCSPLSREVSEEFRSAFEKKQKKLVCLIYERRKTQR